MSRIGRHIMYTFSHTSMCTHTYPAALKRLPSNQYRFQRGSGGEARRGVGDDEEDDLRAYALR